MSNTYKHSSIVLWRIRITVCSMSCVGSLSFQKICEKVQNRSEHPRRKWVDLTCICVRSGIVSLWLAELQTPDTFTIVCLKKKKEKEKCPPPPLLAPRCLRGLKTTCCRGMQRSLLEVKLESPGPASSSRVSFSDFTSISASEERLSKSRWSAHDLLKRQRAVT